ncbi:glycosyltransferase family 39 protein [Clostridiaceae bacterium 35-E11]
MLAFKKSSYKKYIFCSFFMLYIIVNIIYLSKFPFMHSDESWLSGLSRNILERGSYAATESFFDLKVRNPHAIKIIFHTIQIIFIKLLGYSLFNMRLISFIFGIFTLYFFYRLCSVLFTSKDTAMITTLLLSMDIQFLYASHFARQEIILLFVCIYGFYFMSVHINNHKYVHDIILGITIGLSIGIHPNSFIISLPFGCIYLYHILHTKNLRISNLLFYVFIVGFFAVGFILLSKSLDPHFLSNYTSYGQKEFGVLNPITSKISQLKYFYLKLFYQVSGTYYTPNIKFQFLLFGIAFLGSLFQALVEKDVFVKSQIISVILAILAINLGILLIGRYNQTSVVFLFPLFYILVIYLLNTHLKQYKGIAVGLLLCILSISTLLNVTPYIHNSYHHYLQEISKVVNKNSTVLANLNAEYYFGNGKLYDYRNLEFLKEKNMSFQQYIEKNHIEYIIYPEELDFIYHERPRWNGMYGNLLYYEDMHNFFEQQCEKVYEFTEKAYSFRIAQYINKGDWKIKIYKVLHKR